MRGEIALLWLAASRRALALAYDRRGCFCLRGAPRPRLLPFPVAGTGCAPRRRTAGSPQAKKVEHALASIPG